MSIQPRKERKKLFRAPLHEKRKVFHCLLEKELRKKYGMRMLGVVKGDTVKVMRGQFKGTVEKVAKVDYKKLRLHIENVTVKKADGKLKPYPVHPSNVMIVKLNLTDPKRRAKLKEEAPPKEEVKEEEKPGEEEVKS
ncbi:MAG: 50S ribosomal protein L24 [Thermoplasmata archaeon]|nr:50S ribosomal protein L24 [Thermoplasmata archaeon]